MIPDETVGQTVGAAIQGAGGGNAEMGVAGPPFVLNRAEQTGMEHVEHQSTCRNLTVMPGRMIAGGDCSTSQSTFVVLPINRQPPGLGRG